MPYLGSENTEIVEISQSHNGKIENFSCGSCDEDEFLKKDALANQSMRLSQTYLLFEKGNGKIISFITLNVGSFKLSSNRKLASKKIRDKPFRVFTNNMPCLHISRLATDRTETGRGGATLLISFAIQKINEINRSIPIPFLALDAYSDKVKFYEKLGFEIAFNPIRKNPKTIKMFMEVGK